MAAEPAAPEAPHRWELPAWRWSDAAPHWSQTDEVVRALRERLGLDTTVLRSFESFRDQLFVGTAQCFFCTFPITGGEVWRRDAAACGG